MNEDNQIVRGLIAVAVLGLIIGGVVMFTGGEDEPVAESQPLTAETESPEVVPPETEDTTEDENTSEDDQVDEPEEEPDYTNGTYSATGSYSSPGGTEEIGVEVTLRNDTIASVNVTNRAEHPTAKRFQDEFIGGIVELVTGVDIDEANVGNVAGSSLTGGGFNQALNAIRTDAQQ